MAQCSEQNIKCIEEVEWSRVTYGDVSKKPCEFDHYVPSISMLDCHIVSAGLCNTVHCIAVYRIRTERSRVEYSNASPVTVTAHVWHRKASKESKPSLK